MGMVLVASSKDVTPKIQVVVATHKPYWMPDDPMYRPLHVGAALHPDACPLMEGDDTGDSISEKNASYCELTAQYWAWRNVEADYLGLAHYRRHFAGSRALDPHARVLSAERAADILRRRDVIVPEPRHYYVESIYSHYAHAHPVEVLDAALQIIRERTPEYRSSIDRVMNRSWAYLCNMWIAPAEVYRAYCSWLYPVLSEVELRVDTSGYDAYNLRAIGFMGERLFNVYLDHQMSERGLTAYRLPVVMLESQHWPRKARRFLERKLRGEGRRHGA